MAANREQIVVNDGSVRHFDLVPTGKGARGWKMETRPWQPGAPYLIDHTMPWRVALHPWHNGLNRDRLNGGAFYNTANADATFKDQLRFPPLLNAVAVANMAPVKEILFNGVVYTVGGQYLHSITTGATAAIDMNFGAGNSAVDACVFNGELLVAMGETVKIWKRTKTAAATSSGTADVAVTTTDTTLADTRATLQVNAWIGGTVTCNGKTMVVTSNTSTTFTGAAWSGGSNPGNGHAWSATGFWTQATDATYAIALGLVGNALWRAETTNQLSSCTTAPLTLTSWAPASGSTYPVGDTSYAVHTIIEYGGVAVAIKGDGAYFPDAQTRFRVQTPQMQRWPFADNGKGAFVAQGYLFVPSIAGLLRITAGQSKIVGPERAWANIQQVAAGVEWGDAIFLLTKTPVRSGLGPSYYTSTIIKMMRDTNGSSGREYIYHQLFTPFRHPGAGIVVDSTTTANPLMVFPYADTAGGAPVGYAWFRLGGALNYIDDTSTAYPYGLSLSIDTGLVIPDGDRGIQHVLEGVEMVSHLGKSTDGTTQILYSLNDAASFTAMLTTQEGSGSSSVVTDSVAVRTRMYAAPNTVGQYFNFRVTSTRTSDTPSSAYGVMELWAFGHAILSVTDLLTVSIAAHDHTRTGLSGMEILRLWRYWFNAGTIVQVDIPGYETNRTTRFKVIYVEAAELDATRGTDGNEDIVRKLDVTLQRIDLAGAYAAA